MKIYVAAYFPRQQEGRVIRYQLEQLGHEVTSTWLEERPDADPYSAAIYDLVDVKKADAIVVLNQKSGGCGMWIELGYALALGKKIFILDPEPDKHRTVFMYLAEMNHIKHVKEIQ